MSTGNSIHSYHKFNIHFLRTTVVVSNFHCNILSGRGQSLSGRYLVEIRNSTSREPAVQHHSSSSWGIASPSSCILGTHDTEQVRKRRERWVVSGVEHGGRVFS